MAEPLRHRQTKGAETDMPSLPPPRHIPTLPIAAYRSSLRAIFLTSRTITRPRVSEVLQVFARDGVARALGLPQDKVHGIWVPGPGSYGRNDAGDAGIDAALLSKAVGRPVRVQGMRYVGHGWDHKGPASIHRARIDQDGA